ncbi:hypothetical protein D3C72_1398410 [compost metagenome]
MAAAVIVRLMFTDCPPKLACRIVLPAAVPLINPFTTLAIAGDFTVQVTWGVIFT